MLPYVDDDPSKRVWEPLAEELASPRLVDFWIDHDRRAGLGTIMGNGLVVLDVDDWLFSEFLKQHVVHTLGTWVNLTGRDFVHIFLRTDTPPRNGRLLHPEDGRKLADIRYTHAYVGAPPSFYSDHGATGVYRFLHGGPESIRATVDADRVWDALVEAYCQGPPRRAVTNGAVGESTHDRTIRPPLVEDTAEHKRLIWLLQNHTPSITFRRQLLQGYDLKADFPTYDSHSEVDWMICKELVRHNWTDEEVIWAYCTLPFGQDTYQNARRDNHGDAYLLYTLSKARAAVGEDQKQLESVEAQNGRITRFVKVLYPDPVYLVSFEFTDGKAATAKIDSREITSVNRFIDAVIRGTDHVLRLQPGHLTNNGFKYGFLEALFRTMEEVQPPQAATEPGQIRQLIRRALKRVTLTSPRGGRFGWFESGDVYIPVDAFMEQLEAETRGRPPRRSDIWDVVFSFGGRERRIVIEDQTVVVWTADARLLED